MLFAPLTKNARLITTTTSVSSNSTSATATGLSSKNDGSGNPHITYPIDTYISATSTTADEIIRARSPFVASSACSFGFAASPLTFALYPAASTAFIIASSLAVPSTCIELVSKLTEQAVTPSTLFTAFSTRALHAAQVIPFTSNFFINVVSPTPVLYTRFFRLVNRFSGEQYENYFILLRKTKKSPLRRLKPRKGDFKFT